MLKIMYKLYSRPIVLKCTVFISGQNVRYCSNISMNSALTEGTNVNQAILTIIIIIK